MRAVWNDGDEYQKNLIEWACACLRNDWSVLGDPSAMLHFPQIKIVRWAKMPFVWKRLLAQHERYMRRKSELCFWMCGEIEVNRMSKLYNKTEQPFWICSPVGEFLSRNVPCSSLFIVQILVLPSCCEVSLRKRFQRTPGKCRNSWFCASTPERKSLMAAKFKGRAKVFLNVYF